jgi:large subunit ribosomal protein L27
MAHKKGQGSSRNGRDTIGKRLGVKKFAGQHVVPGNIIVRQRGTTFHAGRGAGLGRDYTVFAIDEGLVAFVSRQNRTYIEIVPANA